MGETLKERRRVEDEGLRIVNSCHVGASLPFNYAQLIVPQEEETANSVPAAAVIQRSQALFGITGRKGCVGGEQVRCEIPGLNPGTASDTAMLEDWRGDLEFTV